MNRRLLAVLACPTCHGDLDLRETDACGDEIRAGALQCRACEGAYGIAEGIATLGDPEALRQAADWWPEGLLTDELFQRSARSSARNYEAVPGHARWVDAAARVEGVIVDIASGPGGSLLGALMPRLGAGTMVVVSDASAEVVTGLKRVWDSTDLRVSMDFVNCDANHLPLRDGTIAAFTSVGGFDNVRVDRRLGRAAQGEAYAEAVRALRPGGLIFDGVRVYSADAVTARHLAEHGDPYASRETLEALWASLGLGVQSAEVIWSGRGKSDPADGLPLAETDEWESVAYVVGKPDRRASS